MKVHETNGGSKRTHNEMEEEDAEALKKYLMKCNNEYENKITLGKKVYQFLGQGVCSKGRKISLPCENRGVFLEQKFWLSRLLPRTVLLDLDTGADDVTTSGPSYRCGRQGRTREYK